MVKKANQRIGLDEVSCEVNDNVDAGLKNEIIAHFAGEFCASSVRVWVRFNELACCDENDNVTIINERAERLQRYIDALKEKGVEHFLVLAWSFLYPKDFNYVDKRGWSVPDPCTEREKYVRFLNVQKKLYELIVVRFPDLKYFEPTNEADGASGEFLHREGYVYGATQEDNAPYLYSHAESIRISLDLCYFATRGVKKFAPDAKILLPSFCNFPYAAGYLAKTLSDIQSGKYPSVCEEKSSNYSDYFEIMSFHPASLISGETDEIWLQSQKILYEVMREFGAGDVPVWYSEFGWSDFGRESEKEKNGPRFIKGLEVIEKELPFVEKVFLFRLCTLADRKESEGEDNFGLIYNIYDEKHSGEPKSAAIMLAKYLNGDDYDVSALYKFAKK